MIKPMLCNVYTNGKTKVEFPCYVQPKLDGVRCMLSHNHAYTRSLKPHKDHIQRLLHKVNRWKDATFDGELMLPDSTFQETVSAVKKDYPELTQKLMYCVYDFVGRESETFHDRMCDIYIIVPDGPNVKHVPTYRVETQSQLDYWHEQFVQQGYEGSIIRKMMAPYRPGSRSCMWKRKDFKDAEYQIIAVWEGSGKNTGTPVFRLPRPDYRGGDEVTNKNSFGCVPEGTYERKREMWKNRDRLIGSMLTVRFQELTDAGIPRFPVGVGVRDYE